ncbi:helix-turn-helix transcriptional regulator [Parapedobacter sp. GCM10030251]|uniref:helix-turn-helix transcriptional regulator n=1 Tax=Parapedobacter sp. GCM10030251 TaxID=3273419 RepID=UPI00361DB99B
MKKTLKTYRLDRHLSQQELADQSGISLRTVQRIESGTSKGSPYIIRQLCNALRIDPRELFFNEPVQDVEITMQPRAPQETDATVFHYDRRVKYINFGALSVLCFPFLNLHRACHTYAVFKPKFPSRRDKAAVLKILDLQILWSVTTLIALIVIPVVDHYFMGVGNAMEIPLFVWAYLLSVIVLVLMILNTAHDINKSKDLLVFVPDIL